MNGDERDRSDLDADRDIEDGIRVAPAEESRGADLRQIRFESQGARTALDDSEIFGRNESGEGGAAGVVSADWAVPWADLMMVMFVLFAVLFVYQLAERDLREAFDPGGSVGSQGSSAPGPEGSGSAPAASSIFELSEQAVRETDLEDIEVELQSDDSVKLSVRGPMFFDLGRAELRPATRGFLDRITDVIGGNEYEIEIIGHTDSFPVSNEKFPTNWELSAVRATSVARYLIERGDLDPGRFTVIGHSMYRPSAPNTTLDNKARNRRVEIVITRRPYQPAEVAGT